MKDTVEKLLRHSKIFFSQQGEDGLLAFVLSKIPNKTGWCVEFGAWDGKSESNTYYFISQQSYHGVMIEADPSKFKLLRENMKAYDTICVNAFPSAWMPAVMAFLNPDVRYLACHVGTGTTG